MELNRRTFLQTAGAVSALAVAGSAITTFNAIAKDDLFINKTEHKLMDLPYDFNALEPHIDSKTVELHYSKHHQAYVAGLNKAEAEIVDALGRKDLSLIDYWMQKQAFHGAGNSLHNIYWNCMKKNGGGDPTGLISDRIKIDFGSLDNLKMVFNATAKSVEGSGWALLVLRPEDKKLVVMQVENHQKFTTWNVIPLLAIDVWEHAYYLKYQNKRADYVEAWWNLVNWDFVNKELDVHLAMGSNK